jgi:cobalt-zinc-cadmium efflux system membrane fusion protein
VSVPTIQQSSPPKTSLDSQSVPPRSGRLTPLVTGVVAVGLLAVGAFVSPYLSGLLSNDQSMAAAITADSSQILSKGVTNESPQVVALSPGKLAAAEIRVEQVSRQTLTHEHSVPGRVVYDDNRHIEVTAPTGGILTQVLVKPGDRVQSGQVLAWLNSPEIGTARADVLQQRAEAELTATLANRASSLEKNVVALTAALKKQPQFDAVKAEFAGRTLGDFRNALLTAYSETQLAESLLKGSTELAESGALSGKAMLERQAAANAARASLESACEQAGLDVWQKRSQAEAAASNARRRVEIARQHLASLLSDAAILADTDMPEMSELGASDDDLEHLSRVAVRAPFGGTIESRAFSSSERVREADSMFVLADTATLWVTAEIRENDWPAVAVKTGETLRVTVPALSDEPLEANVEYIGREVSPDTNAIPIVAVIDNAAGRLRPGLFVRVAVPVGVKADVLTVQTRAVLQHEGNSFVFVAESDNRFKRVDVETGDDGEARIEIVSGLEADDRVVTHGAFILKSELLLEGEDD